MRGRAGIPAHEARYGRRDGRMGAAASVGRDGHLARGQLGDAGVHNLNSRLAAHRAEPTEPTEPAPQPATLQQAVGKRAA